MNKVHLILAASLVSSSAYGMNGETTWLRISEKQLQDILDKGCKSELLAKFLASGKDNINATMVENDKGSLVRVMACYGKCDVVQSLVANKADATQDDVLAAQGSLDGLFKAITVDQQGADAQDRKKMDGLLQVVPWLRNHVAAKQAAKAKVEGKR